MRNAVSVFVCLCLVMIVAPVAPAMAQRASDNVFVVSDVPVQAQAQTATAARQTAIDQGRRRAMDILLRRMTAEADWGYLPRLAIGEQAAAAGPIPVEPDGGIGDGAGPPGTYRQDFYDYSSKSAVYLDPSQLPALEDGFFVSNEKSSQTSYSAQITYRFKPDEIRNLLKSARIPYSESQTRTALIIPVLQTESGGMYLWETNNPWARAWLARPLLNELTPLKLPRGDAEDVNTITARQALNYYQPGLQQLAEKYGVSQVILASAYLTEADDQFRMRIRLMNAFLNSAGVVTSSISPDIAPDHSSRLYDDADGFGSEGTVVRTSVSQPGEMILETWYRGEADDFPLLALRAVESTVAKYSASWKAQTLIDHSVSRLYRVNAWFTSIDEWASIQSVLNQSPLVVDYQADALTADGATVTMRIAGDIEQLVVALREANIIFWTVDDFTWNIASSSTYEQVKERVRPVSFEQRQLQEQRLRQLDRQSQDSASELPGAIGSGEGLYDPQPENPFSPPIDSDDSEEDSELDDGLY